MTQGDPNKKGYVYILVNPAFPGFLKIGKTAKAPEARARELSSGSGVPAPYAVAWDTFVDDCDQVERLIHQQLAHARSRGDREFFAIPLKNAISVVSNIVGPSSCKPNAPLAEVPAPADTVGSPVESHVTAMTDSPVDLRMIPSLETAGYSRAEITDLQSAIASFERSVLPLKKEREAEAEEILRRSKGEYTDEILEEVFDKVDKGPIGPITGPWFGETLSTNNRRNVYALRRRPEADLNILIHKLRETGDLGCLGEWRRAGNRGMRTGVATLFMYLHAPDRYNIWLPKTHSGLSRLCNLGAGFPKKEILPAQYRALYDAFNKNTITLREKNGLAPQTMDWFLFAVDEIKTNPANAGLRALIEGRLE